MGTHLRVLSEISDSFQKSLLPCAFDESSLSIERVKGNLMVLATVKLSFIRKLFRILNMAIPIKIYNRNNAILKYH